VRSGGICKQGRTYLSGGAGTLFQKACAFDGGEEQKLLKNREKALKKR